MKTRIKQSLMVGATVATLGLGFAGAGLANASSTTDGQTTLIEKLASKFNLNKDEVAAVFTADRQEHQGEMQAKQAERLAQAVTDGKLTQAQADYIANAQKEIHSLMSASDPQNQSDAQRDAVRTKIDALRDWATTNNVDMQYVGPGGHGGPGGPGGGTPPTDAPASSSSN